MRPDTATPEGHGRDIAPERDVASGGDRRARPVGDTDSVPQDALPDGVYDVVVVAADPDDGGVRLALAITAGSHKGAVVGLRRADTTGDDPVALLGLPGTLRVADGRPHLDVER